MRIQREKLLGILEGVRPGIAKKEIIEESANYVFANKQLVTYNDRICVMHPLKCGFQCSIQSDTFYKLISKFTDEVVDINLEGDWLKVKSKSSDAELAAIPDTKVLRFVKELKVDKIKKWKPLPKKMTEAFKWCLFSASSNASIPYLTGILITNDYIMSTDELRISHYKLKSKMDRPVIIPADSVKDLIRFEPVRYALTDAWIFFRNENEVTFCSRLVSDDYPADDYLGEFDFKGKRVILPGALKEALDVTQVLAEGDIEEEKRVDISIKKGVMKIKAEKQEVGWVEKRLRIKYKKEGGITFTINPIFLSEILAKTDAVLIGEDRVLFQVGEFKHLVSLFTEE
jgi:DNA polymerase III sliding clamp (beta) subunit (PCNA family)